MSVNQTEQAFFKQLTEEKPSVEASTPQLPQLREIVKALFQQHAGPFANIPFSDKTITARDGFEVKVRIFNPDNTERNIIFLPGNAFLFDIFAENSVAASRIAINSKARVFAIDHRIMPEAKWPTPIDDIEDVLTQLFDSNTVSNDIYLTGICSGAQAATLLALRNNARIKIKKLILVNGLYDQTLSQTSHREHEKSDGMIDRDSLDWWFEHYNFTQQEANAAIHSPLFSDKLHTLPPTHILIGEHDGFRSDSEALHNALLTHKVRVHKEILPGQTHNTMILRGAMHEGIDPAARIADIILETEGVAAKLND